jgi:hypothetical protein
MLRLPLGLGGVVAEDVATPSLPIADNNLFGLEVVLEGGESAPLAEHITLDLGNTGHTAGEQVLATGPGQFGPVVFGVHPRVGDKHRSAKLPAAKVGTDPGHGCDIGGVAWEDPTPHRDAVAGDGQGNHHLRRPVAFLGVPELAQGVLGSVSSSS